MAFDTSKSKHAVAQRILKLMGYNSFEELRKNCAVIDGDPGTRVVQTGLQGATLVLDKTNDHVYIRTGWHTTAATYYIRII